MGINFYLITGKKLKEHTKSGFGYEIPEEIHIGKDSYGWLFHLCAYPERGIACLKDWTKEFQKKGAQIRNEYGDVISPETMKAIIEKNVSDNPIVLKWREGNPPVTDMSKKCGCIQDECIQDECGLIRIIWLPRGNDGNYVMDTRTDFS